MKDSKIQIELVSGEELEEIIACENLVAVIFGNIFDAFYVESKSGFPENARIRIFGQKWAFNIVCYIHRCLSRHTIDFNGESSTSKRPWKRTNKY